MKNIAKPLVLFIIGGSVYFIMEVIFRGYSHWTMFILGGLCFFYLGLINELIPWEMPLQMQGLIGAGIVTALELVAGCILNLWLGWSIWDYSDMPFNIMGQICLPFSLLWILLSIVAIILDDYLRYWLFGEDKPHYCI